MRRLTPVPDPQDHGPPPHRRLPLLGTTHIQVGSRTRRPPHRKNPAAYLSHQRKNPTTFSRGKVIPSSLQLTSAVEVPNFSLCRLRHIRCHRSNPSSRRSFNHADHPLSGRSSLAHLTCHLAALSPREPLVPVNQGLRIAERTLAKRHRPRAANGQTCDSISSQTPSRWMLPVSRHSAP